MRTLERWALWLDQDLFAVICICAFPLNLQGLLPVQSGKGG